MTIHVGDNVLAFKMGMQHIQKLDNKGKITVEYCIRVTECYIILWPD